MKPSSPMHHHPGHLGVVADEVGLGDAVGREQHFVRMGYLDLDTGHQSFFLTTVRRCVA
jgi:hypothetical protein